MGEAKKRATYEERKSQAIARKEKRKRIGFIGHNQPLVTSSLLMQMAISANGPMKHPLAGHHEDLSQIIVSSTDE